MSALSPEKINIIEIISQGMNEDASHLYFKVGCPVFCRKNDKISDLHLVLDEFGSTLSKDQIFYILRSLLSTNQMELLEKQGQLKSVFSIDNLGPIELTAYSELSTYTLCLYYLHSVEAPIELPANFMKLVKKKQGLVLITGADSEKNSLTIDAVINFFDNCNNKSVLVLGNDEHVWLSKKSKLISYRVKGSDFETYQSAVDFALLTSPDVLIIKELNDLEVLESVLHLSLSGTLVFACGYTQTVAETIVSYLDMGANPALLANSLAGIMSTSVVPKLCGSCKKSRDVTAEEALLLGGKRKEHIVVCEPGSCKQCGSTGYSGEVIFTEVMEMSRGLRKSMIYKQSLEEIEQQAECNGMESIRSRVLESVKRQKIAMRDV